MKPIKKVAEHRKSGNAHLQLTGAEKLAQEQMDKSDPTASTAATPLHDSLPRPAIYFREVSWNKKVGELYGLAAGCGGHGVQTAQAQIHRHHRG